MGHVNGPSSASFSFIFFSFIEQAIQIIQQINVRKCPSNFRCWDSNSKPSYYEPPSLTTRPGLPFTYTKMYTSLSFTHTHRANHLVSEKTVRTRKASEDILFHICRCCFKEFGSNDYLRS